MLFSIAIPYTANISFSSKLLDCKKIGNPRIISLFKDFLHGLVFFSIYIKEILKDTK